MGLKLVPSNCVDELTIVPGEENCLRFIAEPDGYFWVEINHHNGSVGLWLSPGDAHQLLKFLMKSFEEGAK